jgi:hypothetical protein
MQICHLRKELAFFSSSTTLRSRSRSCREERLRSKIPNWKRHCAAEGRESKPLSRISGTGNKNWFKPLLREIQRSF